MTRSPSKPLFRSISAATIGLAAAYAQGTPTIDTVNLLPEGSIAVEGSAFGDGPNVALYDDFSDASFSNGNVSFNPQKGSWYQSKSNGPLEDGRLGSSSNSIIASQDSKNISSRLFFGEPDPEGVHGLEHFQEVYIAYTIKDAGEFPGRNGGTSHFSDISSTKDAWMMFGDRGDNTSYAMSQDSPAGHDLYIPAWAGGGFNIAGNNTSMDPSYWQGSLKNNWAFGDWVTKMFHAKLDPTDPYGDAEGFFAFLNKNTFDTNHRSGNFMSDQTSEGVPYPYWDRIKFFAWLREGDADVKRLLDDVYVATGKNANARLILTDAANLNESTRIHHLAPNTWKDGSIEAEIPTLDQKLNHYIYVVTSENEYSQPVKVQFNDERPNPPTTINVE